MSSLLSGHDRWLLAQYPQVAFTQFQERPEAERALPGYMLVALDRARHIQAYELDHKEDTL